MDELNILINDLEVTTTLFNAPYIMRRDEAISYLKYLKWLKEVERICEAAFNDPMTENEDLNRAQALANIYAIFLYDGATIKEGER